MQYEVTIIDVKDADAIVVNYHDGLRWWTAVIDAGNVGDGEKVKGYVRHKENSKCVIDYAFCTHPDKDHKGGFFELLTDDSVCIKMFYIRRPDSALLGDPRVTTQLLQAAKQVYNHPIENDRNLIDEIVEFSSLLEPPLNEDVPGMPLRVIGPRQTFFREACYQMASDFSEIVDDDYSEKYAEDELPSEDAAKSVMDEVKECSPTNLSSLILLFHPDSRVFLLSGDACSATIKDAIEDYPNSIPRCTLKVPHHGSKHNLTTEVIDLIRPSSAVISCKGTKKHPNPAVVHFLSKHCNVYSTSKCNGALTYQSAPVKNPAIALRRKQD